MSAATEAARGWMHAYGIDTRRYTAGGGDHPMMDTLPAAFEAYAAALPTAPGDDVEALRVELADFAEALTRTNRAVLSIAAQRDAAEAALVKAREVLRQVEWVVDEAPPSPRWEGEGRCPICSTFQTEAAGTHIDNCALAAALTPTDGGPHGK